MSTVDPSKIAPRRKVDQSYLRVTRHALDLVEVPLVGRDIAIGRSPTCDAVLRVRDIPPIKFLVSEMQKGQWFVVDLAALDGESSSVQIRLGEAAELSGFRFEAMKRSIQASDYARGSMESGVQDSADSSGRPAEKLIPYLGDKWLVQVIQLWGDSRVPEDVYHIPLSSPHLRSNQGVFPIAGIPMSLRMQKDSVQGDYCLVDCSRMSSAKLWLQGESVEMAKLRLGNVLRIDWMSRSYYVRFVNELKIPPMDRGWDGDRFLSRLLSWVFLPLALLFLLWITISEPEPIKPQEAKRVARIEVLPPPPVPVPEVVEPVSTGGSTAGREASPGRSPRPTPSPRPSTSNSAQSTQNAAQAKAAPKPEPKAESSGLLGLIGTSGGGSRVDPSLSKVSPNDRARVRVGGQAGSQGGVGGGDVPSQQGGGLQGARRGVDGPGGANVAQAGGAGGGLAGQGSGLGGRGGELGTSIGGRGGIGGLEEGAVDEGGGLDKETVQRVVRANSGRLRLCYEQALTNNPSLRGKVTFNWLIRPAGSVQRVSTASSELGAPLLETCLNQVIQQMVFPQAPNGRPTQVVYPFFFEPR